MWLSKTRHIKHTCTVQNENSIQLIHLVNLWKLQYCISVHTVICYWTIRVTVHDTHCSVHNQLHTSWNQYKDTELAIPVMKSNYTNMVPCDLLYHKNRIKPTSIALTSTSLNMIWLPWPRCWSTILVHFSTVVHAFSFTWACICTLVYLTLTSPQFYTCSWCC